MAETHAPPPASERPWGILGELFERRRLLLFLAVLVIEFGIFAAGLFTPLSGQAQLDLQNQTNTAFASVPTATAPQLASFIFQHNLAIAAFELVPVLGALFFVYSIYVTGVVAQVIALGAGYPGQYGAVLFVFPYSLVEVSAYAMAVGAGVMLLVALRKKRLGRELRVFVLEMTAVVGVLLTAAVMETVTRFSPVVGLLLWIPTGLAVAAIVVFARMTRV